jgi:Zn-finger nucleic acid-binding protein
MRCPTDGSTLTMSERSGIEIDYCPECRGVWLDRGELDKIIDRAGPASPPPPPPRQEQRPDPRQYDDRQHGSQQYGNQQYGNQGYGSQQNPRRKKKENWLSELFD